jgi:putative transposase
MAGLSMDLGRFLKASLRSQTALAAENLFLRKQLALYRERQVKPRRASSLWSPSHIDRAVNLRHKRAMGTFDGTELWHAAQHFVPYLVIHGSS